MSKTKSNPPNSTQNHLVSKDVDIKEHLMDIQDVVPKYKTNLESGLSSNQANELLKSNGLNQLTPPKQELKIIKFARHLSGGFSLLLWLGAALCMVAFLIDNSKENLYLGLALIIVILLTGCFAYYQEAASSAIVDSFKDLIPHNAFVLRDGIIQEMNPKYLVVGDIVEVNGGNQIPADIVVFQSNGCKVDNSSITGESEPQVRTIHSTNQNPLESENLAFFSSYCTEGRMRGIVIRTSDYTVIGQIANLTTGLANLESPIAKEIKHFIRIISIAAVTIGTLFFIVSMIVGYTFLEAVMFFIGIIVANVPEGLLATVTVSLTLSAKSLSKKNCLVKNLEAVETLGSTSIICSDKTGTLTQNKMRVSHVWFNNIIVDANATFDIRKNAVMTNIYRDIGNRFDDFLRVLTLCSRAKYKPNQEDVDISKRVCTGDASEVALFRFIESIGVDSDNIRSEFPIVAEIPFNSTNKFHLTVHGLDAVKYQRKYLICIKGAPERILELCKSVLLNGQSKQLNGSTKKVLNNICKHFANKGERVLAFAELCTNDMDALFEDSDRSKVNLRSMLHFTLLGFMSLVDPPRPEVPDAVDKCRQAGIRVFMVTGDHPITAQAIAESVGIITQPRKETIVMNDDIFHRMFIVKMLHVKGKRNESNKGSSTQAFSQRAMVIPGDILSRLSEAQLDYIIDNYAEIVFARTSPQQKLAIVQSCQRLGHIVGVTGDGVNDSPALKRANIGISMGITGSDVSKEAADMILMDDNFASIIVGVEEGRVIFDNLKKSIAYTLASNFAEIIPFLFYVIFGFPLALGTITILCIDLGTDIFPSISLAYEKPESDIMKQKPRNAQTDRLVTVCLFNTAYFQLGMIQASAGYFTYFIMMATNGFHINQLYGIRSTWDNRDTLLFDSYGKLWNYQQRKQLEYQCQTAYFIAIVVCQYADLIACKTRRNSIATQGMSNYALNAALILQTLIAVFVCYCPGMTYILKLFPLKLWYWVLPIPFAVLILSYDEIRRLILRIRPFGFFEQETYY